MDKDFLIKLTNNLYRLTLLFPKKEPLRYKMRELADEILASLTVEQGETERRTGDEVKLQRPDEKLEILSSFFEVAKSQNWVSSSDILEIQKEYDSLKGELKQSLDVQPREIERVKEIIPGRQQKILEILKEKGRAQVWEIQKVFPEVTKRTLRRDFENLLNQDLIQRIGERNETFYQLKVIRV
jgi:predicted metal-dependent hydrolase